MLPVRRLARLAGLAIAALFAASLVAACAGGGAAIKVSEPWARSSPMVAGAGAAYMKIENTGSAADALVGASSPAAATVEIHETVAMGTAAPSDGMGMGTPMPSASGDAGGGMMGMVPVDKVDIPAGGSVELKPGGYHIMLIDLKQELKPGDTIEITLKFEKAGDVTVTAEVRES